VADTRTPYDLSPQGMAILGMLDDAPAIRTRIDERLRALGLGLRFADLGALLQYLGKLGLVEYRTGSGWSITASGRKVVEDG
jgi:hypothetical protein